jgi:hypothetical protein
LITTALSITLSTPGGKRILIPDHIYPQLNIAPGDSEYMYVNAKEKEIYLAPLSLDPNVDSATLIVENKEGIVAKTSKKLGVRDINVERASGITLGGHAVIEYIIRTKSQNVIPELKAELEAVCGVHKVSVQGLDEFLPSGAILGKPKIIVIGKRSILVDQDAADSLQISGRERYVILTAYSRFPLLVIKIIGNPERVFRLRVHLPNEPNCLAPVSEALSKHANLFGTNVVNASSSSQVFATYGVLLSGQDLALVKESILKINRLEKRDVIKSDSLEIARLEELEGEIEL